MFKKANIEIYELDLLNDIITTSNLGDNLEDENGDVQFPIPLK